jgi:hypothetical protein
MGDTSAVVTVWRTHRRLSHTATRVKRSITTWRLVSLVLAVAGAVVVTLATQLGMETTAGRLLSAAGGVGLAAVPVIQGARLSRDRLDVWTRTRLASERIKSECHLFLVGASPYDGADRAAVLGRRTDHVLDDVADVADELDADDGDDLEVPAVDGVDSYLALRVSGQVGFFDRGAARQRRLLSRFRAAEFGLSIAGAALGGVAAATGVAGVGVWVAVVTTVGGAVTAHVAANRYQFLLLSYRAAARRLRSLERAWRAAPPGDADPAALVRDCEEVIARQNDSWMAGWMREDADALAGPDGDRDAPAKPAVNRGGAGSAGTSR